MINHFIFLSPLGVSFVLSTVIRSECLDCICKWNQLVSVFPRLAVLLSVMCSCLRLCSILLCVCSIACSFASCWTLRPSWLLLKCMWDCRHFWRIGFGPFGSLSRSKIAGPCGNCFLHLWENSTVFQNVCVNSHSYEQVFRKFLSHTYTNSSYGILFWFFRQ